MKTSRTTSDASSNALQNTDKEQRRPPQYSKSSTIMLVLLMPTKARDQGQRSWTQTSSRSHHCERHESAIAALEENDGTQKQVLQYALKGVRKAAMDVPVGVQLSTCEKLVERDEKHLATHDEVRGNLVLDLQEGQTRLSKLRAEVAKVLPAQACSPPNLAAEVARLQQMVDTLTTERSAVVQVPRSMSVMPSDLQDLERWLLDRHADLRDALEFADCGSIVKLTALLVQSAAKLHAMSDEDMLLRSAPLESPSFR